MKELDCACTDLLCDHCKCGMKGVSLEVGRLSGQFAIDQWEAVEAWFK